MNQNIGRDIDHIVYAVKNLDHAIQELHELLGVRPVFGGHHKHNGTKNALLNLGNSIYLEVITKDKDNLDIPAPRWMGVDLIQESKVTRWSLKSTDLKSDAHHLSVYQDNMGVISGGSRQTSKGHLLEWEMILPLAEPEVEVIPFMTDWQKSSVHPTDKLETECTLMDIKLSSPNPEKVNPTIKKLNLKMNVEKTKEAKISLIMKCPNGIINLN